MLRPGVNGGELHILHSDRAVLASDVKRTDLPCEVEPLDPNMEYDLSFEAGYVAKMPLSALAGPGNSLRVLFRIQPLEVGKDAVYFRERYTVPPIEEGAEGSASLPGRYRLGPGRYRVDWLMRDRAERVCSSTWEIEAKPVDAFDNLATSPLNATILESTSETFRDEPPLRRSAGRLLNVRILLSLTPTSASSASLSDYDTRAVISMLRAIAREPRIGSFDVIAYNAHEERVIFEQQEASQIDFRALGRAAEASQGGLVALDQLKDKDSGEKFLHGLLGDKLRECEGPPDAIIVLGPKVIFERSPASLRLSPADRVKAPIYHFIYNRNPRSYPWRDAVSATLKEFETREFDIINPKDFGMAIREMIHGLTTSPGVSDS